MELRALSLQYFIRQLQDLSQHLHVRYRSRECTSYCTVIEKVEECNRVLLGVVDGEWTGRGLDRGRYEVISLKIHHRDRHANSPPATRLVLVARKSKLNERLLALNWVGGAESQDH